EAQRRRLEDRETGSRRGLETIVTRRYEGRAVARAQSAEIHPFGEAQAGHQRLERALGARRVVHDACNTDPACGQIGPEVPAVLPATLPHVRMSRWTESQILLIRPVLEVVTAPEAGTREIGDLIMLEAVLLDPVGRLLVEARRFVVGREAHGTERHPPAQEGPVVHLEKVQGQMVNTAIQ